LNYNCYYDTIILAGGLSKRFGIDKCSFEINSKTMLDRVIDQFPYPIVVSRTNRIVSKGIIVVEDGDYMGPIKGIRAGLKYVKERKVFITGCDFPFITVNLADYLCSKNDYDVVMVVDEKPQPLLACYSTAFLEHNLPKVKKLTELLTLSNSTYLAGSQEIIRADPFLYSTINVNSIVDLILRPRRIKSLTRLIVNNLF